MSRTTLRLLTLAVLISGGLLLAYGRTVYLTLGKSRSARVARSGQVVRGSIADRRGILLAYTEEASTIAASPRRIIDSRFTAVHLSRYLNRSAAQIQEKLERNHHRRYLRLQRQVDNYSADRILDLHLPGIFREWELRRVYPGGRLAANLLGIAGRDAHRSLSGLERTYHSVLMQPEGPGATRGPTLHLTIDALWQRRMSDELSKAFVQSGSKRAVGLAMDVHTGEILALAVMPTFDPNQYHRSRPFQRANWASRFNYEPGSTIKVFMVAMLLADGLVRENTHFYCGGSINFRDTVVSCKYRGQVRKHGHLTVTDILRRSCNVGIIKAMQRMKPQRMHHYLAALGFGKKTGYLPGGASETPGYFPGISALVPASSFYMPIGQSFSVTPLQLLRAASVMANGGRLVKPRIALKLTATDGTILRQSAPEALPGPFSPATTARVLRLMEQVVARGTGAGARVKGLRVAGKTGTGQKATARGYGTKSVASFVGFFPAERPRYAMLIVFDEPRGHAGGGSLAAPTFGRILKSIRPYLERGVQAVAGRDLRLRGPRSPAFSPGQIGDFRGLSAREALAAAQRYGLPVRLTGSGYTYAQKPPPGTDARRATRIELMLHGD